MNTIQARSSTGEQVDITFDGERFAINGEKARIRTVDIDLDQIDIQIGGIIVVLNGFQIQSLNTPTTSPSLLYLAHLKEEQDRAEELAFIRRASQIIVSDSSFLCSFPQHIGMERETKKLIVTRHLAVTGQYIMVPICNECWGDLCWRVTMAAKDHNYTVGNE